MTELDLYMKMYAKVVYEVDQTLQSLPKVLTDPNCGRDDLMKFGEKLKQALLDAEEIFMDAEDVEEGEGGDGLQYITDLGITELGNCAERAARSVCADMPNSEQLAQKVKEKFEAEMRQWKEELRDGEEDYYKEVIDAIVDTAIDKQIKMRQDAERKYAENQET